MKKRSRRGNKNELGYIAKASFCKDQLIKVKGFLKKSQRLTICSQLKKGCNSKGGKRENSKKSTFKSRQKKQEQKKRGDAKREIKRSKSEKHKQNRR